MDITGKIIAVLPAREGVSKSTGNNWKSQEYVLETSEQYPRRICFNVFGEDKISQFNIKEGETMMVSFDINAREYNGRWYNDIRAWKVDRNLGNMPTGAAPQQQFAPQQFSAPANQQQPQAPAQTQDFGSSADNGDDLPF